MNYFDYLKVDLTELLERITEFFSMLQNEVWNPELLGLVSYLFSCIPGELRDFMIIVVIFAVIIGIRGLLKRD